MFHKFSQTKFATRLLIASVIILLGVNFTPNAKALLLECSVGYLTIDARWETYGVIAKVKVKKLNFSGTISGAPYHNLGTEDAVVQKVYKGNVPDGQNITIVGSYCSGSGLSENDLGREYVVFLKEGEYSIQSHDLSPYSIAEVDAYSTFLGQKNRQRVLGVITIIVVGGLVVAAYIIHNKKRKLNA